MPGILHNPDSEYAKEMARWDAKKPWAEYPKMLYRALPNPDAGDKVMCGASPRTQGPKDQLNWADRAEAFTARCQRAVSSEAEERRAISDGWAPTPQAALERAERAADDMATAAAEANAAALRMTPKAQAERARREAATDKHVAE